MERYKPKRLTESTRYRPKRKPKFTLHPFLERWMSATVRYNHWRVAKLFTPEELLQEGMICYHKVCVKYPGVTPEHRTALLKTTFLRHIHKLSVRNTNTINVDLCGSEALDLFADMPGLPVPTISEVINEAPEPVARLMRAVVNRDGSARADVAAILNLPLRYRSGGRQQTLNERLCSIAGLDASEVDVASEAREYLYERLRERGGLYSEGTDVSEEDYALEPDEADAPSNCPPVRRDGQHDMPLLRASPSH